MIINKKDTISSNTKTISQVHSQIAELENLKFEESQLSKIEQEINSQKQEKQKLADKNLKINSKMS